MPSVHPFSFYISVFSTDRVEIYEVNKENPQIIENKGLVQSFLFPSACFGLILKELHDSKAITAFLCLYQILKTIKGYHIGSIFFQTLNIRSIFFVLDYPKKLFLIAFKCLWQPFIASCKVWFFRPLLVATKHVFCSGSSPMKHKEKMLLFSEQLDKCAVLKRHEAYMRRILLGHIQCTFLSVVILAFLLPVHTSSYLLCHEPPQPLCQQVR